MLTAVFLLMFAGLSASYASDDMDLIKTAGTGDIAQVTNLLTREADVKAKNNTGATALMAASESGHSEVVKILKKAGAKK